MSEKQEIMVVKDEQKITKIGNEYFYKREFNAKMSEEEKQKIESRLKMDIQRCKEEIEKLNDENYEKALKEIEEKSEKNLQEYQEMKKNFNELIHKETDEEFEQRKEASMKELDTLILHSKDAEKMAKDNLQRMYEEQKEAYNRQLEEQTKVLKIYEEAE
jgi:hypothetical protein